MRPPIATRATEERVDDDDTGEDIGFGTSFPPIAGGGESVTRHIATANGRERRAPRAVRQRRSHATWIGERSFEFYHRVNKNY